MIRLKISSDEADLAESLIQWYMDAGLRLAQEAPRSEGLVIGDTLRLRWVAIGEKYRHVVYVFIRPYKDGLLLSVRPRYPAYLMAAVGLLTSIGYYPGIVVTAGDELRAFMTRDYDVALSVAIAAVRKRYVSPYNMDMWRFQGPLYLTDVGYVATMEPVAMGLVAMEPYDNIIEHVERDWWKNPVEAWEEIIVSQHLPGWLIQ